MSKEVIEVFFDGSCGPGNPGGKMGYGFMVKSSGQIIHRWSGRCQKAPENTNNLAEYIALSHALDYLFTYLATLDIIRVMDIAIVIKGDSQLVIKQMFGYWRIKHGSYVLTAKQCRRKLSQLRRVGVSSVMGKWIPRGANHSADALSRA